MSAAHRNPDTRPFPSGWITRYDSDYEKWYYVNANVNPPVSTWEHPSGLAPPRSPPPMSARQNPDSRPLPTGWITQYDSNYEKWYHVNTNVNPPVSTWEHPSGPPPSGYGPSADPQIPILSNGHAMSLPEYSLAPITFMSAPHPNPDTRPLPTGWFTQYDFSYKKWLYVNTNVKPPVSTREHPSGPPPRSPPPMSAPHQNPDSRPFPTGWITRYDSNYKKWYYVNTNVQLPVSTWGHPSGSPPRSPPPPPSPPAGPQIPILSNGHATLDMDVELLLDSILDALCNDKLSRLPIQSANQKARRLMFELVSKPNIIPKSLFVTDVKTETMIAIGGFGRVFMGVYKGLPVALKVVDKGHTDDSLRKDFCREALAWRSLSHRFILPLLGIFEERSQLFLVSRFMANGTLSQWRKKQGTNKISEIARLMLEVAEGVKYLHSEGIVHGDLHGRNVLLNSEFHCQITDFGSTRHFEADVTRSTTAFAMNFVAPELLGMCTTCGLFDCDGCRGVQKRRKTMETDVYAFGCLYYATFFDSTPFHDKTEHQIVRLVIQGKRPDRLESPRMEDDTWDLILRCWEPIPSKRSTIVDIATALGSPA